MDTTQLLQLIEALPDGQTQVESKPKTRTGRRGRERVARDCDAQLPPAEKGAFGTAELRALSRPPQQQRALSESGSPAPLRFASTTGGAWPDGGDRVMNAASFGDDGAPALAPLPKSVGMDTGALLDSTAGGSPGNAGARARSVRGRPRSRPRPRTTWAASAPWNPTKLPKEYRDLTCRDRVGWSQLPDPGNTKTREVGSREAQRRNPAAEVGVPGVAAAGPRRPAVAMQAQLSAAQRSAALSTAQRAADEHWQCEARALAAAASELHAAGKSRAAAEQGARAMQSQGHRYALRALHALDMHAMPLFLRFAQAALRSLGAFVASPAAARALAAARFAQRERTGRGPAAALVVADAELQEELVRLLSLVVTDSGARGQSGEGAFFSVDNNEPVAGPLGAALALRSASQRVAICWVHLAEGSVAIAAEAHRGAEEMLRWLDDWARSCPRCDFVGGVSEAAVAHQAASLYEQLPLLSEKLRHAEQHHGGARVLQRVYRGLVARRQLEIMVVPAKVAAIRDTTVGDFGASGATALDRLRGVLSKHCRSNADGGGLEALAGVDGEEQCGAAVGSGPKVMAAMHGARAIHVTMQSLEDHASSPLYSRRILSGAAAIISRFLADNRGHGGSEPGGVGDPAWFVRHLRSIGGEELALRMADQIPPTQPHCLSPTVVYASLILQQAVILAMKLVFA
eukprot:g1832.t1